MLAIAIVAITGALVLYTVGVWGEKLSGGLKPHWLAFFWLGLVLDTAGTAAMGRIAGGEFRLDLHGVTGLLAIVLMGAHALWATLVLLRRDERAARGFHKLSIVVWAIWLVPYLSGVALGSGAFGN